MNLILVSMPDPASMRIFKSLLKLCNWTIVDNLEKMPIYKYKNFILCSVTQLHLYSDNVDRVLKTKLNTEIDTIIFASKHKSRSGIKTLTVHPLGNFGNAEFGGKPRTLVPTSPNYMSESLRMIKKFGSNLDYQISLEVTHHGPYLDTPTYFIEIGSDERMWTDEKAGDVIAQAILNTKKVDYPVSIGIGGGHYAPRFTDIALKYKIAFGHIAPSYAHHNLTEDIIDQMIKKSPKVKYVYFHAKTMTNSDIKKYEDTLSSFGVTTITESELEQIE